MESNLLWVLTADDRPTGFAVARVLNNSRHILQIDIDPKMGRRGLGTRLMTQSIEDARAAGARHRVAMRLLL